MKKEMTETKRDELLKKIHAYRETQLIYIAAQLKISDYLKDGGKTIDDLATLTHTHKESLYRVLRALTSIGLYDEKEKVFFLNDDGMLLCSDIPGSIRSVAIMRGEEVNWKPWGELLHAVKTGTSAFRKVFGMDLFDYYEKYPESGKVFNDGMRIFTEKDVNSIVENYDFSEFKTIVDVGGGNGSLIISILEKYKTSRGVLYDLPRAIEEATIYKEKSKADERLKMISGNMFTSVPPAGDCYLLKKIIHDWDDERCISLLKNCRNSIADNGVLLIIEMLIQEDRPAGKVNDVHMMVVCPGGKERTRVEFESLLHASGFRLSGVISTETPLVIIEGIPIKP